MENKEEETADGWKQPTALNIFTPFLYLLLKISITAEVTVSTRYNTTTQMKTSIQECKYNITIYKKRKKAKT